MLGAGLPSFAFGQVAQSVEQGTENPRVGGSIPPLATIFINKIETPCFQSLCHTAHFRYTYTEIGTWQP